MTNELIELMKKLSKLLAEKDLESNDNLDNIREEENEKWVINNLQKYTIR